MSKKIAQVLCISGIFCFFTLVLALTYDGNREWKTYQKEFYRLEAAKAPDAEKKQDIFKHSFGNKADSGKRPGSS